MRNWVRHILPGHGFFRLLSCRGWSIPRTSGVYEPRRDTYGIYRGGSGQETRSGQGRGFAWDPLLCSGDNVRDAGSSAMEPIGALWGGDAGAKTGEHRAAEIQAAVCPFTPDGGHLLFWEKRPTGVGGIDIGTKNAVSGCRLCQRFVARPAHPGLVPEHDLLKQQGRNTGQRWRRPMSWGFPTAA